MYYLPKYYTTFQQRVMIKIEKKNMIIQHFFKTDVFEIHHLSSKYWVIIIQYYNNSMNIKKIFS